MRWESLKKASVGWDQTSSFDEAEGMLIWSPWETTLWIKTVGIPASLYDKALVELRNSVQLYCKYPYLKSQ